ncbi:MAG: DUF4350 domain-containing protein [Capsulimonadales bacterium]|nr:DUF4350 domain-containing protein [Capsulimonadales bacterium]
MKLRGDTLMVVGLLLIFGVLSFLIAGNIPETPETTPRRSSFSAKPGGLKAAFLLLQERGVPVRRVTREPRKWPRGGVMVTATPFTLFGSTGFWDEGAADAAIAWVENGGTLIVAQSEKTELLENLGLSVRTVSKSAVSMPPKQPAGNLVGVRQVSVPDPERFSETPPGSVVLLGDTGPALIVLRRGQGKVFAFSTPAVFDNRHLASADNARLLVGIIEAARGGNGTVYFDEYHMGYAAQDSLLTLIGKAGQFVCLELLILLLLMAYNSAVRFGLPRSLPPPARVSSEYVASLADLYRRARATDAALESLYGIFKRDLCRTLGIELDAPIGEIARRAATLAGDGASGTESRLLRLLGECEDRILAGANATDEGMLLHLTQDMEDMRKELQLGGSGNG